MGLVTCQCVESTPVGPGKVGCSACAGTGEVDQWSYWVRSRLTEHEVDYFRKRAAEDAVWAGMPWTVLTEGSHAERIEAGIVRRLDSLGLVAGRKTVRAEPSGKRRTGRWPRVWCVRLTSDGRRLYRELCRLGGAR